MKKILVVILMFLVFIGSGTTQQKTIDQLNGFDWAGFTADQKAFFIVGFIAANNMVMEYMNFDAPSTWTPTQKSSFMAVVHDQFGYDTTVAEVARRVDTAYANYDQRQYAIWQVIMGVYGKDFWNKNKSPIQSVEPIQPVESSPDTVENSPN